MLVAYVIGGIIVTFFGLKRFLLPAPNVTITQAVVPQDVQVQQAAQAQQAAAVAQQDQSGANAGAPIQSTSLPQVAAQVASQLQAQPQPVVVGPAQDNTSTIDPRTGLNTQQGVDPVTVSDPSLLNQAQNLLGI